MILKGCQRAGAGQMARHLLKAENEHVELHELRGFIADELPAALQEAYAVSQGTRCKQFMFSLSLNPPETESVPISAFESAIHDVEKKLGLVDQPRAIVFHEKEGRRHAHVVWSRINAETMTAVNLPHYKLKLRDISRELYLEHGWQLPRGLMNSDERDPLNFTQVEWEQARRGGNDPKALKAMFQECWASSDSAKAYAQALKSRGFYLAKGDQRGFVAVDYRGEVYAIARWTGLKTKDVKARLGDPDKLLSVSDVKARIAALMNDKLKGYIADSETASQKQTASLAFRKADLVQRHRVEREKLKSGQEMRWNEETSRRAARLSRGLRGVWDRLTGKYGKLRAKNEREALQALRRDRQQVDDLIQAQLIERRRLQEQIRKVREAHTKAVMRLHREVAHYVEMAGRELKEDFNRATEIQKLQRLERQRRRRRDPGLNL